MMHELAQALPADAIVADEAITSRGALLQALEPDTPGRYYSIRGGALGWAMPGALGIQLANPAGRWWRSWAMALRCIRCRPCGRRPATTFR